MTDNANKNRKDFSKTMTHILNYGALNLAIAIGYRTRLFDVMDASACPETVSSIAKEAGLNERYVREWLGIMVSGEIIELSVSPEGEDLFTLPKSHADHLTRRSGNANLGVYTQEIPLLIEAAMDAVLQGFYTGDGVGYDHYPQFQHFMSQLANAKHREVLINTFLPSISHGKLLDRLKSGIRVCDIGCAEGIAVMLMAEAFPKSIFLGIDISSEAIGKATRNARAKHLSNVSFIQMDAAVFNDPHPFGGLFDYVMAFDAIHDQTQPLKALKNVYAILKEDGVFSMVDIAAESDLSGNKDHEMGPFLYTVSLMHCMPVGLMDGGRGLGMMWGRQKAVAMLREAGFNKVQSLEIPNDPFNLHFLCEKGCRR